MPEEVAKPVFLSVAGAIRALSGTGLEWDVLLLGADLHPSLDTQNLFANQAGGGTAVKISAQTFFREMGCLGNTASLVWGCALEHIS